MQMLHIVGNDDDVSSLNELNADQHVVHSSLVDCPSALVFGLLV